MAMKKNPCGAQGCKYHFADMCFSTVAEIKKFVMPNAKGQVDFVCPDSEAAKFEILVLAMEAHPDRDLLPDELPDNFFTEWRGGYGTGERPHKGWQPRWSFLLPEDVPFRFAYRFLWDTDPVVAIRTAFLREVVRDQLDDVRRGLDDCDHVHHEPPFKSVLDDFLKSEGLTLAEFPLERDVNGRRSCPDTGLVDRWVVYHAHNTELIPMTREEHMYRHRELKAEQND